MESVNQFHYIYENIAIYQFRSDWIIFLSIVIFGIITMALLYYINRYFSLQVAIYHADSLLAKKKKTLGDLILMKDIQTELEKEIEQAILKAAFHN
ncbi:hypothetical protein H7169_01510 [Candidatus Gracilibacteria bacterium]|nr:hypothetical protein [Candidatus Gracilibacteria bacterium]